MRRRPADCGMPVDGVSFQKNAGYEDCDTDEVFPRQAVESNALLSLWPVEKAGYMVKSMRLIPTNKVGQACERVRLPRLRVKRGFDQERGHSKVENDTLTLNEKQGEVHPRRKDKTPNAPWVAYGVRSVAAWRHLKTSSTTSVESNAALIPLDQPTAEDWLATR